MAKNTKVKTDSKTNWFSERKSLLRAIKTDMKISNWFNSRTYGKSLITAIRNPKSPANAPGKEIDSKPVKPLKEGGNMWYARKVLEAGGKMEIDDAVTELLKIHTLRTKNPLPQAKKIFLHSNSWGLPTKITKEGKKTYIELA